VYLKTICIQICSCLQYILLEVNFLLSSTHILLEVLLFFIILRFCLAQLFLDVEATLNLKLRLRTLKIKLKSFGKYFFISQTFTLIIYPKKISHSIMNIFNIIILS
jgi:hypothetical protein